jgi:hypothetical protein
VLNSKLIEILKTFSPEELKNLEKFAKGTYFNKGRDFIRLLRILKKIYPGFNNSILTKKSLHEKMFPGKKYNYQMLRNMFSGLQKICEEFIVFNRIRDDRIEFNLILSDDLRSRMLLELASRYAGKSLKILSKAGLDGDYFRRSYELTQMKREINQSLNNSKEAIESLSEEAVYFFYFFLMETSRHIEEMSVYNHNLNANFEEHLTFKLMENLNLENLTMFLSNRNYENSKIAELFAVHIRLMMDYKNEHLFEKFRGKLRESFEELSRWGKYNMYLCLENACVRLQAVNEIKYRTTLHDIYKEQLKNNLYNYSETSHMALDMFRNIIINALRLRDFEWVEFFINNYINTLQPDYRENMYNFSFSLLYFEKGSFEESLRFITQLKYDTFVFKFDVRVLTLMIYYELNYIEEAISLLDSFRHFVSETKMISNYVREIHINFIRYYNELIKLSSDVKTGAKEYLTEEINNSKVRNKEWLLKKILSCP